MLEPGSVGSVPVVGAIGVDAAVEETVDRVVDAVEAVEAVVAAPPDRATAVVGEPVMGVAAQAAVRPARTSAPATIVLARRPAAPTAGR